MCKCVCVCVCVCDRRKSKQALRDYKKVQIQLENLETSVRDRCKKEFTGKKGGRRGANMKRGAEDKGGMFLIRGPDERKGH